MIREFGALAFNSFREARRNRVSVVVAAFALALLASSSLVTRVTVYTFDRVVTDLGLGSMSLTLVMLAIFLSSGQLSREIERRTIFLIMSKPVSRPLFLLGRFAGNMLTLLVLLVMMFGVFLVELVLTRSSLTSTQVVAAGMLWIELFVLSSIGFAMSSFSSQMVSAVVTTGMFFAGHLSEDIYALAEKAPPALAAVAKGTYYLLPNLARLNYRMAAAYELTPKPSEVLGSAVYGLSYAAVMLGIAVILFERRDFK